MVPAVVVRARERARTLAKMVIAAVAVCVIAIGRYRDGQSLTLPCMFQRQAQPALTALYRTELL